MTPPGESAISYTWDDNGNLTDRGSDEFEWDYEDRMTSATVDSATTTFAYRGDGLRDSRTFDSNTTTFTWDIAAGLPVGPHPRAPLPAGEGSVGRAGVQFWLGAEPSALVRWGISRGVMVASLPERKSS